MAKTILVHKNVFDELFDSFEDSFKYNHHFATKSESNEDFKETRVYKLLQKIRGEIPQLKRNLENA